MERQQLKQQLNRMMHSGILTKQDREYIATILVREKEAFTQTRDGLLFDLCNYSDKTISEITRFLNVTEAYHTSEKQHDREYQSSDDDDDEGSSTPVSSARTTTTAAVSSSSNSINNSNSNYSNDGGSNSSVEDKDENNGRPIHPDIINLRRQYYQQRRLTATTDNPLFDKILRDFRRRAKARLNPREQRVSITNHVPEFMMSPAQLQQQPPPAKRQRLDADDDDTAAEDDDTAEDDDDDADEDEDVDEYEADEYEEEYEADEYEEEYDEDHDEDEDDDDEEEDEDVNLIQKRLRERVKVL
jgi:hypothetical protein